MIMTAGDSGNLYFICSLFMSISYSFLSYNLKYTHRESLLLQYDMQRSPLWGEYFI